MKLCQVQLLLKAFLDLLVPTAEQEPKNISGISLLKWKGLQNNFQGITYTVEYSKHSNQQGGKI